MKSGKKGMKLLQSAAKCGKLNVKNGWVTCPVCRRNHRLLRVEPETEAKELPVYCTDCKTEIILNIERGRSVERRSP